MRDKAILGKAFSCLCIPEHRHHCRFYTNRPQIHADRVHETQRGTFIFWIISSLPLLSSPNTTRPLSYVSISISGCFYFLNRAPRIIRQDGLSLLALSVMSSPLFPAGIDPVKDAPDGSSSSCHYFHDYFMNRVPVVGCFNKDFFKKNILVFFFNLECSRWPDGCL